MNKVEINIGLNNNPLPANEIIKFIGGEFKHNVQVGTWEGADEPTLVIEFTRDIEYYRIVLLVQRMTTLLTQDAIAFRFNGLGVLIFNPSYTGERYPFDEQYFLTIK